MRIIKRLISLKVKFYPLNKLLILFLEIKSVSIPFLFLAFELPATPLFQDEAEKNIIPQVDDLKPLLC